MSTELFTRLDDEETPPPKRLKLAQNAYFATGGSSERILSWICSNLKNNFEVDFNRSLTEWEKLATSVHTQHVRHLVKIMLEGSIARLQDYEKCSEENTFECLVTLLGNPRIQNYFFTDIESYISLVETLLASLTMGLNKDVNVCKNLFDTVEVFARMMPLKEFPALFLDRLFLPSVQLVYNFGTEKSALEQQLLRCVEMAVFYRNTPLVLSFLNSLFKGKKSKQEQGKENQKEIQKSQFLGKPGYILLEKLTESLNRSKEESLFAYATVFKSAMKCNNPSIVALKLLIAVSPLFGINVSNAKLKVEPPPELSEKAKSKPDELSFSILETVLSIILREGIALPDDNEFPCLNWIECLWRTVLSVPLKVRQTGSYFRCLSALLQLHPRVILHRNMNILTDLLVVLTPEEEIPEFVTFMHVLLSIHQKRFSVNELLTSLFTNSKQILNTRKRVNSGTLSADKFVPPSIYADLQKYAADWPSTPVLEFVDFILTQLQTLAFTSDAQRSVYTDSSTSVGVRLLCGVLTGARIVDHCGNEKLRLMYVARFKTASQLLKQMAVVALNSENAVLMRTFLELQYAWASVVIMLQQYCPEGSAAINESVLPTLSNGSSKSNSALTGLHCHISSNNWALIKSKIRESEDGANHQLLIKLQMQSLRYFCICNPGSQADACDLAKELSVEINFPFDFEDAADDVYFIASFLGTAELKNLTDKFADLLFSSDAQNRRPSFEKSLSRLQEKKNFMCGTVFSVLEKLLHSILSSKNSDNDWPTTRKILEKFTTSATEKSLDFIGEDWTEELKSLGKVVNKAFKNTRAGEATHTVEELSRIAQILEILNLLPLPYLPESLQSAVIIVLFSLSADLSMSEVNEDKKRVIALIHLNLIAGVLERWRITNEAPPVQKYLHLALAISHLKLVTQLETAADVSLLHTLLGLSLRSTKSVKQVLDTFFASDETSATDPTIRLECLKIICQDSLAPKCRQTLNGTDCEARVVAASTNAIQSERPKKQLLSEYSLLLSRAIRKKENFSDFAVYLDAYCKEAIKCIRKNGHSRQTGEEFIIVVFKFHELQKNLPRNFIIDVWTVLCEIDNPNTHLASLLLSSAQNVDFDKLVGNITKELEHTADSSQAKMNILPLWESLVKSPLIQEDCLEKRQNAVSNLLSMQHVFLLYPTDQLLKVLLSIVESSKVVVQVYMADNILQALSSIVGRGSKTDNMKIASAWFAVLDSMLFHRSSQTLECLPAFTAQLRLLIQTIVHCSRQSEHLAECLMIGQGVEKMFQTIVKAKMTRNFIRIGAYLLADLLKHFEGQLPQDLKVILENVACEILGFLDSYAQRFLGKAVNAESAEILREIGRIRALRRHKIV